MFLSGYSTDVTAVFFFFIASEFGVDDDLDSLFNPVELPRESDKRRLWEREKIIKDRMVCMDLSMIYIC